MALANSSEMEYRTIFAMKTMANGLTTSPAYDGTAHNADRFGEEPKRVQEVMQA